MRGGRRSKEVPEPKGNNNLTVTGADGKPIQVQAGDYYTNTKARCQRIMRQILTHEAVRVYMCLELATMGFHQELAVKLERGRQVPLTPADISRQTGLKPQNVSRALNELEAAGLVERRDKKGSSRSSRFVIYSWAIPHKPTTAEYNHARYIEDPELPPSWKPLLTLSKRLKIKKLDSVTVLEQDSTIEEGERLAREYAELESRATDFLRSIQVKPDESRTKAGRKPDESRNPVPCAPPPDPEPDPVPRYDPRTPYLLRPVPAAPAATPGDPQETQPEPAAVNPPHTDVRYITASHDVRYIPPEPVAGFLEQEHRERKPVHGRRIPPPRIFAPLKRTEEFVSKYPDTSNPETTRRAYIELNTPQTEDFCHACLDRYLRSDRVERGIVMKGHRWLVEQSLNKWGGSWKPGRAGPVAPGPPCKFCRQTGEHLPECPIARGS
jgi:DNA-binding transcriptional ArsR family regulator